MIVVFQARSQNTILANCFKNRCEMRTFPQSFTCILSWHRAPGLMCPVSMQKEAVQIFPPGRGGLLHIYPLPLLINYWQKSLKCPPVCKCFKTHLQIKLTSSGCYVHEIMNSLEISEAITCHIEILSCLSALIWRNSLKLLFLVASLRKMWIHVLHLQI